MRKTLFAIVLMMLFGFPAFSQTSVSCTPASYCGNTLGGGADTTGNNGVWYGFPSVVTASSNVTNVQISIGAISGTPLVTAVLVCDSNTSGTTVGNSSPCPSNNVVCSSASNTPTQNATNTWTLTGCGTLSTSARYWIFFNNNNTDIAYKFNNSGSINAYYKTGTCCTAPASFTGTVTATTEAGLSAGINITVPAAGAVTPGKALIF